MGVGVVETGVPHADRSTFVLAGDGGGTYGVEIAAVGVDDDDPVELGTGGANDLLIIAAGTSVPIERSAPACSPDARSQSPGRRRRR